MSAAKLTRIPLGTRRLLHSTNVRRAITNLEMPAMSPTMTEGGISSWKKKDGESFTAGDVLLEIETDKATIDVEAQDDGIMGKILVPDGTKNILVGKVIALLAEEGDDISNLKAPEETPKKHSSPPASPPTSSSPPTSPSHKSAPPPDAHVPTPISQHLSNRPMFPSVHRLLMETSFPLESVKGTGVRGMLTKGDVLAYLGRASGPLGTFKEAKKEQQKSALKKEAEYKPLDGPALRRIIVSNMLSASLKARNASPPAPTPVDFDTVLADYLPSSPLSPSPVSKTVLPPPMKSTEQYLDGLI